MESESDLDVCAYESALNLFDQQESELLKKRLATRRVPRRLRRFRRALPSQWSPGGSAGAPAVATAPSPKQIAASPAPKQPGCAAGIVKALQDATDAEDAKDAKDTKNAMDAKDARDATDAKDEKHATKDEDAEKVATKAKRAANENEQVTDKARKRRGEDSATS